MKKLLSLVIILISTTIVLQAQDTITITFGSDQLKDAYINIVNDEPDDTCQSNIAAVWTYHGEYGIGRGLFGFDFSEISDQSIAIIDARLNMYHDPIGAHMGHSTLGGENSGVICRIIEKWSDKTVTWANQPKTTNTNSVYIPAPESDTMDFLNVDITPVIKDIFRNPTTSDGFMIKLNSEENLYRSLLFASSDHPMSELHPSIEITYITDLPVDSVENVMTYQNASVFSSESMINKNTDESLVAIASYIDSEWILGRGYFSFDLTSINSEHTITFAEINLYHNPESYITGHENSGVSNDIFIRRVSEDWDEDEISWENQPEITIDNEIHILSSNIPDQDYINIEVTDMLIDHYDNNSSAFGLCISMFDEETTDYNRNVVFASKYHPNPALHPELVVYTQDYTGVEHTIVIKNDMVVFPNPSNELFTLKLDTELKDAKYKVVDTRSYIIKSGSFSGKILKISMNEYTSGVYFLLVEGDDFIGRSRLIKH